MFKNFTKYDAFIFVTVVFILMSIPTMSFSEVLHNKEWTLGSWNSLFNTILFFTFGYLIRKSTEEARIRHEHTDKMHLEEAAKFQSVILKRIDSLEDAMLDVLGEVKKVKVCVDKKKKA
jgi:hypothetical protein